MNRGFQPWAVCPEAGKGPDQEIGRPGRFPFRLPSAGTGDTAPLLFILFEHVGNFHSQKEHSTQSPPRMFKVPEIQLNAYGKPAKSCTSAPMRPTLPFLPKNPTRAAGYPQYHYNIYKAIQDIGYDVVSSSSRTPLQFAKGNVDYVFSLMNRFRWPSLESSSPPTANSSRCPIWALPSQLFAPLQKTSC